MRAGRVHRTLLFIPPSILVIGASSSDPQIGNAYEIVVQRDTESRSDDGSSSSSSHDRDAVVERILSVTADGVALEYELPRSATADERASVWQFPFRITKSTNGAARLMNASDLEGRVDAWLKSAGMTRAACGTWIFTWNAFLIECDPKSALSIASNFTMQPPDLRSGASFEDAAAIEPATLTQGPANVFHVKLTVDPIKFQRGEAESDVVVAKISGKPISLEAALKARASEKISGSITVTFEADSAGVVQRRTRRSEVKIVTGGGRSETRIMNEVMTRRPLPALDASRSSHVAPSV